MRSRALTSGSWGWGSRGSQKKIRMSSAPSLIWAPTCWSPPRGPLLKRVTSRSVPCAISAPVVPVANSRCSLSTSRLYCTHSSRSRLRLSWAISTMFFTFFILSRIIRTSSGARRGRSSAVVDLGLALARPGVQPLDQARRGADGEVLRGRHASLEQQLAGLMVGAHHPVGDRQAEEARDRLVARHVGVVHVVEAVELSPHGAEAGVLGGALPPLVGVVLDRVQDLVQAHREQDRRVAAYQDRRG